MHGAATRSRRLDPARLLLVIAAVVGVVGMHALVVGTPTVAHPGHATHLNHAGPALASGSSPTADAATTLAGTALTAPAPAAPEPGSGHGPADHSGLAHLCLALAAAIFLLLVRRNLLAATSSGPAGPVALVRTVAGRWNRPPPDPVAVLCVSRT